MPKRMLQLIGALLAVASLTVVPSVASGHTDATASGNPCDHYAPWSNWGDGWWNHDGDGRYWHGWGDGDGYFDGHSWDRGCGGGGYSAANAAGQGGVHRVMVAVKRLRGGKCQHMNRTGRLGKPRSCGATNWMRAKGTGAWRFDIPKRLPSGRYRLHRRAIDTAGNRERPRAFHVRIR